jgi:hypothetical protein
MFVNFEIISGREQYMNQYRNGVKINTFTNEPDYSYDRPRFLE